jgi:hypothetical protein
VARARYANNALTHDGIPVNIVPNATITLYEAGTTTPLADTIYAGLTGGATLSNPFVTDAHGNVEFYLDVPKRVKIAAAGVGVGTLTADNEPVLPDPADMVVSGTTSLITLAGGLSVSRNADAYALTVTNLQANNKILDVKNAAGTTVATWNQYGLAVSHADQRVYIGGNHSALPTGTSTLIVGHTTTTTEAAIGGFLGWVTADFGLVVQSTNKDHGVTRAVASQSSGNSSYRAVEAHVIRTAGSGDKHTWAHEAGVHSSVAPSDDQPGWHVGLSVYGSNLTWLGTANVRQSTGLHIWGDNGWRYGILYHDTNNSTVLFRVSGGGVTGQVAGDVMAHGSFYLDSSPADRLGLQDYTAAPSGQTWAGMYYSATQTSVLIGSRSNGGTGYGSVLLAPNTSAGGRGAGVGISAVADIGGAMFAVAGALAAKKISTPSNPASGYSGLYPKTDEHWYRLTSGGLEVQVADLPIILVNTTFGDLTGAGLALSATTETDLTTNQSFTVAGPASVIAISWRGYIQDSITSAAGGVATRMRLDSAGADTLYYIGGERVNAAGNFANPLSGSGTTWITGLSAGTHTVKLRLFNDAAGTAHMRATGSEQLALTITEFK